MAKIKRAWSWMKPWLWVCVLVVVGGALAWQVLRVLPSWIEETVKSALVEKGYVATAFPVERVGPRQTKVGPGTILLGEHVLRWDSLLTGYNLTDLPRGRISRIQVDEPWLSLQLLPPLEGLPETLPPPVEAPVAVEPEAVPAEAPVAAGEVPPSVTVPVEPVAEEDPIHLPELPGIRDQLLALPLNAFSASDGVVEILLRADAFTRLTLNSQLDRQPFGLSGELSLENEWLAAHVALRVPEAEPVVTLQGEAVMPPGAVLHFEQTLHSQLPIGEGLPRLESSGRLVVDSFLEFPEEGDPYGSLEVSIESLGLALPVSDMKLSLQDALVAGTLKDGLISLDGGAEVEVPGAGSFSADPFAMRFGYDTTSGLEFETESFQWNVDDVSAESALRGSLRRDGHGAYVSRVEWAFSKIEGKTFSMEPFSILLLSSDNRIDFKSSPTGITRQGTVWLEDVQGFWDAATYSGEAEVQLFGPLGNTLGSLSSTFTQPSVDAFSSSLTLLSRDGTPFLHGQLSEDAGALSLDVAGRANLHWLNSLGKWWGMELPELGGADPEVALHLSGKLPFLSGEGLIKLAGLSALSSSGLHLEGIEGDINFEIRSLPRSSGRQTLHIREVTSGKFLMTDVSIDWELPTFRDLNIHRFMARVGGGELWADPFLVDPMAPVLATRLHFEGLDGEELLRWLGEDRFAIQGAVSGSLSLGWEDGTLIVGKGQVVMDTSAGQGRFIFSDPDFVKDRFASFGGVPEDVKQRFLDALLRKGIQINSMTADLGPASKPGHLLLRISLSGETKTELLEVPIEGLVINNIISGEDLGHLLGLLGPIRIETDR